MSPDCGASPGLAGRLEPCKSCSVGRALGSTVVRTPWTILSLAGSPGVSGQLARLAQDAHHDTRHVVRLRRGATERGRVSQEPVDRGLG